MNHTLEDTRKGANDVGRILESKQLRANTAKSRFVVIGLQKSRTEILKEAADNSKMMGDMIIKTEYKMYRTTISRNIPSNRQQHPRMYGQT